MTERRTVVWLGVERLGGDAIRPEGEEVTELNTVSKRICRGTAVTSRRSSVPLPLLCGEYRGRIVYDDRQVRLWCKLEARWHAARQGRFASACQGEVSVVAVVGLKPHTPVYLDLGRILLLPLGF
jgi:hypothetical protein